MHTVLVDQSANVHHLASNPLEVLFTLFLAPAEHWLGQLRWVAVGGLVYARDIGVSYFLLGLPAVPTYRIARPWR